MQQLSYSAPYHVGGGTMGKSDKKNTRLTCPHCGKDITEYANRVTAGRAGRVSGLKRPKSYYRKLINDRWAKEKAAEAEGKKDSDTRGKDDTPPSPPQNDAIRRA
jgi:hypothetical protein